ncbi:purine nucleoside phosphorylase I, inosine and guanosine-specific [Belliella baltica DSM 15883]|uniref:Purine nucleoside phosphorylase n=1 Tax=Belliella baltica (strain DSM 15883 / CIP 108006 / LMG 21964 / BA134) TaxID=866536 RepID=I3Z4U7_BELBD|nr:purine-nucleoside phosphorylase [Belliella baltica]AFL84265.1 purine nucleoside phosphorylase I, inosine and guanosine-specific [Belliella baltica DSM 15883]
MRQEPEIDYLEQIKHAKEHIQNIFPEEIQIGIILGTGLGQLINQIEIRHEIPYEGIPFFPVSTVESHSGKLIIGSLSGKAVVAMQGRFHYYEGYNMKEVTFPVRVLKALGVKNLYVSNAAGGLNPDFKVGGLMILNDHIDLFPENPLRGKNLESLGVRFPDMSEPYALEMISSALKIAEESGIEIHQGVYVGVQGPNLETKAEYGYLRTIGADAVGMSTIPEVIVARHMDMKVFAISAITDLCSPGNIKKISIAEVLAAAAIAEPKMSLIIKELIGKM